VNFRSQLIKSIVSLTLFIVLGLPSVIQFAHIFEGHDHFSSIEQSQDIHKDVAPCDICNFNTVSFDYAGLDYSNLQVFTGPTSRITVNHSQKLPSHKIINTQLRAPPAFS
jgi:hypothetical protein